MSQASGTALQGLSTGTTLDRLVKVSQRLLFRRVSQLALDALVVTMALVTAYLIRFDGGIPEEHYSQVLRLLAVTPVLYLATSSVLGVYGQVWRYTGLKDIQCLALSVACSSLVFVLFRIAEQPIGGTVMPLGIVLLHPILTCGGWVGCRLLRRVTYHRKVQGDIGLPGFMLRRRRIVLVGAGQAGLYLVREFLKAKQFDIAGFLDDNPELHGRRIEGLKVLGSTRDLEKVVAQTRIDEVVLSMPSTPRSTTLSLADRCRKVGVRVSTVPSVTEILSGEVGITEIRPVQMEDLLGRCSVDCFAPSEFLQTYRGKRIMVTGAGGSIGSELVRQLSRLEPSSLILIDKDENSLYEIIVEIRDGFDNVNEVIADIKDETRLSKLFSEYMPQIVFHAAAYKHVPLMETCPAEAVHNNIIGTRNVVSAADRFGVERFVLISTDKAVNPSSVMGASKRVAEMIVQGTAAQDRRYCSVRFGNVLGSRASVVPLFQKRIRQGKTIPITHPDVERYFMTIPEAVHLVIQAGSMGQGGEIFMLDMGKPVKIIELARNLIRLSGLEPEKDVRIEITGMRPGEKLQEQLMVEGQDTVLPTRHSKIFVVNAACPDPFLVKQYLLRLEKAALDDDDAAIRTLFGGLHIGYKPPSRMALPAPVAFARFN